MALNWQTVQIPLSSGISTKGDKRAQQPPALDIASDVEFDEIGGLRTRKPYVNLGLNILGGGTVSNPRQIIKYGTERLLFSSDTLYSWDAGASAWVSRGTHLAVKTREAAAFSGTDDRHNCDMAELGGVTFYAWETGTGAYLAATDSTTGAVVFAATSINGVFQASAPRLVALSTRVLCFYVDQLGQLSAISLNPASIAIGAATVIDGATLGFYDAERIPGADTAIIASATSGNTYLLKTVTAGLTVTSSAKARTTSGAIAIACTPDGAHVQVIRRSGSDLQGDYITISGLADVTINQAVTTANASSSTHIAAAYSSVQVGGTYRCHAFWSVIEYDRFGQPPGQTWHCTVDANGTISTSASMASGLAPCSRAFDVGGRVFVNLTFAEASYWSDGITAMPKTIGLLQNTYFLFRDDGFQAAKSVALLAGGYAGNVLPGITLRASGAYAWCGCRRRVLPLGDDTHGYSGRRPVRVEYTFDSAEARRCAQLGRTLYIAGGGELLAYDGAHVTEVGFHLPPWNVAAAMDAFAGNVISGTYGVKLYWRWDNAQGERERSTASTAGQVTLSSTRSINVTAYCAPNASHKTGPSYPAAEFWRTARNPTADAPFYLVSAADPAATGSNGYVIGDPAAQNLGSAFNDNYADDTATTKETDPEDGGALESIAPPACTLITAGYDRLYIAGIPSNENAIWYSKTRDDGEIAAFNDALAVQMPPDGGAITGLQWLNETLIVFKETSVFALPGDGFDNLGGSANMGPARLLSSDVGAESQEAIAVTPDGLIFKSAGKGWFLLDRGWAMHYIGAAVAAFDAESVVSAEVIPGQQQVRVLTTARGLTWDYYANAWSPWTISGALGGCVWSGAHAYLTSAGPFLNAADFSGGTTYGLDAETAWIKPADLQGSVSVRRIMALGEYRGACHVRIRIAYDYQYDGSGNVVYTDDETWNPSPTVIGGPLQVRQGTSRKRCESIKIRITAVSTTDNTQPPATEAIKLTGVALEVGARPGLFRRLPAAQKQ